jgi:biotin transport system substrate-specific component
MNSSSRQIATVSLFAALIAVFGLIPKIDLPLGVPITLQTLGVMLAGALLAVALFLAAVALGLPLLSGGRGGPAVFVAPSAGYLIGWPLGAWVTALVMQALPTGTPRRAAVSTFFAAIAGGLLVVHACGVLGLMLIAQLPAAKALLGTLLFVPGDLIKALVTAGVVHTVARGLPDWQLGGRVQ